MVKINAREFALAVVTSSSPELSVEDKSNYMKMLMKL